MDYVYLERVQIGSDVLDVRAQVHIEGVPQGVGGIGAHQKGPVSEFGKPVCRGRGGGGLPDPALACVDDEPHDSMTDEALFKIRLEN